MTHGDARDPHRPVKPAPEELRKPATVRATKGDAARAERVKAALKANIGRRKAQLQARDAAEGEQDG